MRPGKINKRQKTRGAALAEYGLIVGLILLASIAAVAGTGGQVKTALCSAANAVSTNVLGREAEACALSVEAPFELGENERFVEAPTQMVGDFGNVLYPNATTGARLVMTQVARETSGAAVSNAPSAFWLDTEIRSLNAYEPAREIASCYMIAASVEPICSMSGANATIQVPASATAFGYLVTVGANTSLPWGNDVAISIPGIEGAAGRSWSISVARVDAPPVREIAFDIPNQVFSKTDTGWLSSGYAPITGDWNTNVWLKVGANNYMREICYRMVAGGAETCARSSSTTAPVSMELPVGAAEVELSVAFGGATIGSDYVVTSTITAHEDATLSGSLFTDQATHTRPNEPASRALSFDVTNKVFEATDTGWMSTDYAPITGIRNVDVWVKSAYVTNSSVRMICYRIASGDETCSPASASATAEVGILLPPTATEIALMTNLPAKALGGDYVYPSTLTVQVSETNVTEVFKDNVTVTRPNEAIKNALSFDVQDKVFAQTDTGWMSTDYAPIIGERNVDVWVKSNYVTDGSLRKICYRTATMDETCSGSSTSATSEVGILLPPEAMEIALQTNLPVQKIGADYVFPSTLTAQVSQTNTSMIYKDNVSVTRPNEPVKSAMAFDIPDHVFDASARGWQMSPWVPITGDRNVSRWLKSSYTNTTHYRRICYTMTPGGDQTCSPIGVNAAADTSIEVPVGAAEIALQVNFGATNNTNAYTFSSKITVHASSTLSGTTLIDQVTLTRPGS